MRQLRTLLCSTTAGAVLLLVSGNVAALGLGELTVDSRLFQPLSARIDVTGASFADLAQLDVSFGTRQDYLDLGKVRPALLSQIDLAIHDAGSDRVYLTLRTQRSFNDPVLDLIITIRSPRGQIQKSFQLLLDPPAWSGNPVDERGQAYSTSAPGESHAGITQAAPVRQNLASVGQPLPSDTQSNGGLPTTREALIAAGLIKNDQYGPVRDGDRLSLIAQRTRLDRSVTINQMMMAYVRLNPGAFDRGNLSGLRQGQVLRIPTHAQAQELSRARASLEVSKHFRAWESGTPLTAEPEPSIDEGAGAISGDSSLRILGAQEVAASPAESDAVEDLSGLTLTDGEQYLAEELASVRLELQELRTMLETREHQITANTNDLANRDAEIASLKELLSLRTDQIKQLEQRLETQISSPPASSISDKTVFSGILALLIGLPGAVALAWFLFKRRSRQQHEIPLVPVAREPENQDETSDAVAKPHSSQTSLGEELMNANVNLDRNDEPIEFDAAPEDSEQDLDQTKEIPIESGFTEPPSPAVTLESNSADGVLEEVEVYLAYGLFHQSEELLSASIESQPDNVSYRLKLLETLLLSNKYDDFEARTLEFKPFLDTKQWEMIERYAVDAGVRPSFFTENAEDFTDWLEKPSGDLEFSLDNEPDIVSDTTLSTLDAQESLLAQENEDDDLGDLEDIQLPHDKTGT
ncbi:MAG: FimV/HubP family polar landmark protein [Pseudomonadota bacterium]